jgi:hypothetical protein
MKKLISFLILLVWGTIGLTAQNVNQNQNGPYYQHCCDMECPDCPYDCDNSSLDAQLQDVSSIDLTTLGGLYNEHGDSDNGDRDRLQDETGDDCTCTSSLQQLLNLLKF